MHGVDGWAACIQFFFSLALFLLFYNSLAYETDNQQNTADNGIKVTETLIETMASNLASMEPDERHKMVGKSIFHAVIKILIT